ncbi:MAG: hydroxymethylglutaryl-CoA reductase [Acidobacteriota bacterium]
MKIPALVLKQLYNFGSLENVRGGAQFTIKNRLMDATIQGIHHIHIDGEAIPAEKLTLTLSDGESHKATAVSDSHTIDFPLRQIVTIKAGGVKLDDGKHEIAISVKTDPHGDLTFKVKDAIAADKPDRVSVPYSKDNDYGPAIIRKRRKFVEKYTGATLKHVSKYSIDPKATMGNVENFTGVAQIPLGFAGPIHMRGEYAQGEFLVPLATTEGTLVASYNRGIKVINLSGGVLATVSDDCMQRAPVFIFDSAREARDFRTWVNENLSVIAEHAEATSSIAKLLYIDTFLSNKFAYLRFNFSTGDAAGQNMVGRATFAACSWILEQHDNIRRFYLESNLATDKKGSQVNTMRTRGKRVTAEVTIPRDVLVQNMRVEPESLAYHASVANVGAFLSGANNNGCHSPNAITAMFIATGQDVANVAESSAAILYNELTPDGDLHLSITIPSLIVATYGGGTSLPTQRECLETMDCYGRDRVRKLAEIIAGVALAGEISLASAISSLDWVSSHEKYGRNR